MLGIITKSNKYLSSMPNPVNAFDLSKKLLLPVMDCYQSQYISYGQLKENDFDKSCSEEN